MVDFSKSRSDGLEKSEKINLRSLEEEIIKDKPETHKDIGSIYAYNVSDDKRLAGLNEDQVNMTNSLVNYLKGDRDGKDFYTVHGGGGVGKSYTIGRVLMGISPKDIIAAAPSHFAKNVLKDFLGDEYDVITIASLLAKKVSYNDEGKEILVPVFGKVPPIVEYPLVLIDEGSMIDDTTANEIIDHVRSTGAYLIILGE